MTGRSLLMIGVALIALQGTAQADTLLLDEIDAAGLSDPDRPARGMTMERVEASFGAPVARLGAIGEPPISRWEYADFVVYFEYGHVIHAVAKQHRT